MPSAYSVDLRARAVSAYENGEGTQVEVAERFNLSIGSLRNYLRLYEVTGSLAAKNYKRGPRTIIDGEGLATITELVGGNADATLDELCRAYKKRHRKKVSFSMMHRALVSLDLRRKKKSLYAQERERADIKKP